MKHFISAFVLWLAFSLFAPAFAAITIDGFPVFCVAANGAPVQEIARSGFGDVARASMMLGPMGQPVPIIMMDPMIMAQYGPDTQARLFVYAHECGHHALGHILRGNGPYNEMQADCWGIKVGRDQGWFNLPALQRLGFYFMNNPGDAWGHLPGPQRVANFQRCFTEPISAQQYQQGVLSGQIRY